MVMLAVMLLLAQTVEQLDAEKVALEVVYLLSVALALRHSVGVNETVAEGLRDRDSVCVTQALEEKEEEAQTEDVPNLCIPTVLPLGQLLEEMLFEALAVKVPLVLLQGVAVCEAERQKEGLELRVTVGDFEKDGEEEVLGQREALCVEMGQEEGELETVPEEVTQRVIETLLEREGEREEDSVPLVEALRHRVMLAQDVGEAEGVVQTVEVGVLL